MIENVFSRQNGEIVSCFMQCTSSGTISQSRCRMLFLRSNDGNVDNIRIPNWLLDQKIIG